MKRAITTIAGLWRLVSSEGKIYHGAESMDYEQITEDGKLFKRIHQNDKDQKETIRKALKKSK